MQPINPSDVCVSLELHEYETGYLLVYANPSSDTHLEAFFQTRAEAEEKFLELHDMLSGYATRVERCMPGYTN